MEGKCNRLEPVVSTVKSHRWGTGLLGETEQQKQKKPGKRITNTNGDNKETQNAADQRHH